MLEYADSNGIVIRLPSYEACALWRLDLAFLKHLNNIIIKKTGSG